MELEPVKSSLALPVFRVDSLSGSGSGDADRRRLFHSGDSPPFQLPVPSRAAPVQNQHRMKAQAVSGAGASSSDLAVMPTVESNRSDAPGGWLLAPCLYWSAAAWTQKPRK